MIKKSHKKSQPQNRFEFTAEKLQDAGADKVELCETAGYPIVYGEKIIDTTLPTVLVYGHYDVQPADPIELWTSPPFDPVVIDNKIYARGSADDKGQFYMHIKAFELMMQENKLPCNILHQINNYTWQFLLFHPILAIIY